MAGFGDLDFMQRSRRLGVGVVMLVLGGVVGYSWPQHTTSQNSQSGQILAVGDAVPNEGPWFTFSRATNGSVQRFRLQFATAWKGSPTDSWHSPWFDYAAARDARRSYGGPVQGRAQSEGHHLGRVL
jgi:hypothetical protein